MSWPLTCRSVNVVSMLRLKSLIKFANSTNPTWDQLDVVYWSTTEVNVGMMCTCLPTLRLILVRLFPKAFGPMSKRQLAYKDNQKGASETAQEMPYRLSDLEVPKGHSWVRVGD